MKDYKETVHRYQLWKQNLIQYSLRINVGGSEGFAKKKWQPLILHIFKAIITVKLMILYVICSNTDTKGDQQNTTRQDDNTIRMPKRHNKPPVTRNDDFYGKKIII
jgi:hypothetical protein